MKIAEEESSRKPLSQRRRRLAAPVLVLLVLFLAAMSLGFECSCFPDESDQEEQLKEQQKELEKEGDEPDLTADYSNIAGDYVHPDGTIHLYATGQYMTSNKEGNTTSGTFSVDGNTIYFHQREPQKVEGTATIKDGVITNSYGQFVKE